MRSARVVEGQVPGQPFPCLRDAVIGTQVDLFVFDRPPQPFDEDVVPPCVLAVHADLDVGVFQGFDEVDGFELAALVRIHDPGFAMAAHRLFQSFDARFGLKRGR